MPATPPATDPATARAAVAAWSGCEPERIEIRETHISWLFLGPSDVFKLKKPVRLEFLDYSSVSRRRRMCDEEVRLNRRLAGELYLGVSSLLPSARGLVLGSAEDSRAVDYLVHMRRYDEGQTLAAAVARDEPVQAPLARLGRALAEFHSTCPSVTAPGRAAHTLIMARANAQELLALTAGQPTDPVARSVAAHLEAVLHRRSELLDARATAGLVREVHGDLRAEHVILQPALRIVDCVEFDPDLRTLDVADDLAFLVMDLHALGAEDAVRPLVHAYEGAGGDCGPPGLVYAFAVHRAVIRAKIALLRAQQCKGKAAVACRERGGDLIGLADRLTWRARGPLVLVVCGAPASGKSCLAAALAGRSGARVLSSDRVRKELAGLAPEEPGPEAIYTQEFSRHTYIQLAVRAAHAVAVDGLVVVDATFRRRSDRLAFRATLDAAAEAVFVQCVVPEPILEQRARARMAEPGRISDATPEVVRRERRRWQPLTEVRAEDCLTVHAERDPAAIVTDIAGWLDGRP